MRFCLEFGLLGFGWVALEECGDLVVANDTGVALGALLAWVARMALPKIWDGTARVMTARAIMMASYSSLAS